MAAVGVVAPAPASVLLSGIDVPWCVCQTDGTRWTSTRALAAALGVSRQAVGCGWFEVSAPGIMDRTPFVMRVAAKQLADDAAWRPFCAATTVQLIEEGSALRYVRDVYTARPGAPAHNAVLCIQRQQQQQRQQHRPLARDKRHNALLDEPTRTEIKELMAAQRMAAKEADELGDMTLAQLKARLVTLDASRAAVVQRIAALEQQEARGGDDEACFSPPVRRKTMK